MTQILEGWNGRFNSESIEASAYSFTMGYFLKSLMIDYYSADQEETRLKIVDSYFFIDFLQRMMFELDQGTLSAEKAKLCSGAYSYKGPKVCEFNMAMAFVEAHKKLTSISAQESNWQWSQIHFNDYPTLPWSKTPLKFLFHRTTPTFGNTNTPHVSKVSYTQGLTDGFFASNHVAGYKMIVAHADSAKKADNLFSIDTGVSENVFHKHYFDMNESHLNGELHPMLIGDQIQRVKHDVLVIKKPDLKKRAKKQEDL
jgi:acyl-homoserine lactone acylase PvdQ